MDTVDRILNELVQVLTLIVSAVLYGIAAFDRWLRGELVPLGLAPKLQTAVLIVATILLVLLAARLFGGVLRVLVLVVLVLLAIEFVVPLAAAPPT